MVPHLGPGERFTTVDTDGRVLVWQVEPTGLVRLLSTPEARS